MRRHLTLFLAALLSLAAPLQAELFLRWNQAGFAPAQPKSLLALSETDLAGREWSVMRGGRAVLAGRFGPSVTGAGDHTPFAFNHAADFSALTEPGDYEFVTAGAAPAKFRIAAAPYARMVPLPLLHLRRARSGSPDTGFRPLSHPGDARAPMWVPDGDPANGKWKPTEPARTVEENPFRFVEADEQRLLAAVKRGLDIAHGDRRLAAAGRADDQGRSTVIEPAANPGVKALDAARGALAEAAGVRMRACH